MPAPPRPIGSQGPGYIVVCEGDGIAAGKDDTRKARR
jgi:hypothetical protein